MDENKPKARMAKRRLASLWRNPEYRHSMTVGRRKPIAERFWSHVRAIPSGDCWIWTGSVDGRGYGRLSSRRGRGGSPEKAHRISWEIHFGNIPTGTEVCHKCDNPSCVNPAHLFVGTHYDNMRDAAAKHRMAHGSRHCCAKLTEDDVIVIRSLLDGGFSQYAVAKLFGVGRSAVGKIKTGHNWKHVAVSQGGHDGR